MSIEAHHCNVPGCKGFVVFENADFDFKDMRTDEKEGYTPSLIPDVQNVEKSS